MWVDRIEEVKEGDSTEYRWTGLEEVEEGRIILNIGGQNEEVEEGDNIEYGWTGLKKLKKGG